MKQIFGLRIAALALLCSVGIALAQRPDGPQRMDPARMVERQLKDMKERLKLTTEQEAKVKPILEENTKKMMAMRQKMEPGNPPSEAVMKEMHENREATNNKLGAILSKEQMAEYEKMMSERRRRFGGPGGHQGPPPRQ